MTLEQQIVNVAESLADKCHNPVRRNTNLWKELRRHYIAGIEAWIQYKLFQEQEQSGPTSMPLPSHEPFNQNTMTPTLTPQERFKKPTDQQLINTAILFNDGKIEEEKLQDMVAMTMFVLDRLYENGDMSIPSSKENQP